MYTESLQRIQVSDLYEFIMEMVLLGEYFAMLVYFAYHLVSLLKTRLYCARSVVLVSALLLSTGVRIVLFLPPEIEYSNTIMAIDIFTAPVCYFTAVSALISQWYDLLVLSKWSGRFERKHMLIKRFTMGTVGVNVSLWAIFLCTIAVAEYYTKDNLLRLVVFRDLLVYDLILSIINTVSVVTMGTMLKVQIHDLVNGQSITLTNWVALMILCTLVKLIIAVALFCCIYYDIFIDWVGW